MSEPQKHSSYPVISSSFMERQSTKELLNILEMCQELSRQIALLIYEFKEDGQTQIKFNELIGEYTQALITLQKTVRQSSFKDAKIPLSLLQWVDNGNIPDGWLKLRLDALKQAGEKLQGNFAAVSDYKNALINALLEQVGPEGEFQNALNQMKNVPAADTHLHGTSEGETIDIS